MTQPRDLVLVICTGNTCRSPMAGCLLRHALAAETPPLNEIAVESAGIAAAQGAPASENSVAALKKVNLDLSQHKSQPVTQDFIDRALIILGMTSSHLEALHYYNYQNFPKHLNLFRDFIEDDANPQIPDPFGQDFGVYQECLNSMLDAVPSIITFLKKLHK